MPEGDTIFKIAAALRAPLESQNVETLWTRARGDETSSSKVRIREIRSVGKHLIIRFDELALRVHLGMKGVWHRYKEDEFRKKTKRDMSVHIFRKPMHFVCFSASQVQVDTFQNIEHKLRTLGPDLLAEAPSSEEILRRVKAARDHLTCADMLLDQGIACGLGNVFKSEILFAMGIPPEAPARILSAPNLIDTYQLAEMFLKRCAKLPGRREFVPLSLRSAGGSTRLFVYNRAGRQCLVCRTAIVRSSSGTEQNRSTYSCPSCQDPKNWHSDRCAEQLQASGLAKSLRRFRESSGDVSKHPRKSPGAQLSSNSR